MAKHNCVVSLVGLCSRVLTHSCSGFTSLNPQLERVARLGTVMKLQTAAETGVIWRLPGLGVHLAHSHMRCFPLCPHLSETHCRPVHSGQWLSAMGAVGSEAVTGVILEGKLPKALNAETESLNFSWEVYRLSECLKIGRITTVHCFLIWMWHWFFPWSTFI